MPVRCANCGKLTAWHASACASCGAPVPRMPADMSLPAPVPSAGGARRQPYPLRCRSCARAEHHRCAGGPGPGCCCVTCYCKQILAEARRVYESSADAAMLTDALGQLLATAWQRWHRISKIEHSAPVYQGTCQFPGCDRRVFGSRYGRKRLYCSRYHQKLASERRSAERKRSRLAV